MDDKVQALIEQVMELEDAERLEFVQELKSQCCFGCGTDDPRCPCQRDE